MWTVEEMHVHPKDPAKGPEDAVVAADHVYAVLDGISDHGAGKKGGMTPGQRIVALAEEALVNMPAFTEPGILPVYLTCKLGDARAHQCGGDYPAGLVLAAFLPHQECIVRVGDCSYLLDGQGRNPGLLVDHVKARIRARMLHQYVARGRSVQEMLRDDPSQDFMRLLLREWQQQFRNAPWFFGYGVVNGCEQVPHTLVEIIPVPKSVRTIVLATDGYPPRALRMTHGATEAALRSLLARDPLCFRENLDVHGLCPGRDRTDDCAFMRITRH